MSEDQEVFFEAARRVADRLNERLSTPEGRAEYEAEMNRIQLHCVELNESIRKAQSISFPKLRHKRFGKN